MSYENEYQAHLDTNEQTLERLQAAINRERHAVNCYEALMKQAKTDREQRQIADIRDDEIHHEQQFLALYRKLSEDPIQDTPFDSCPSTYLESLRHSIEDEQHSVDFYLKSGDASPDLDVKRCFYRMAKDEQKHAIWFLYFYSLYK